MGTPSYCIDGMEKQKRKSEINKNLLNAVNLDCFLLVIVNQYYMKYCERTFLKMIKKHVAKHAFYFCHLAKKNDLCNANLKQSFLP